MKKLYHSVKEKIKKLAYFNQKVIVTVSLILIYFLFLGMTLIFVIIFKLKILRNQYNKKESFWLEAKDYEPIYKNCLRQS